METEWIDHNSEEYHRELLEIEEELMAIMDKKYGCNNLEKPGHERNRH